MNTLTYSLSTEIVKARYPADEAAHEVCFWFREGLPFASSIGGLCYVLTSGRVSYEGCRLVADGGEYRGDEIPAWGAEHLPKSIAIAAAIRGAGHSPKFTVGEAVDVIASRSGEHARPVATRSADAGRAPSGEDR
jgi:hypothetical protein